MKKNKALVEATLRVTIETDMNEKQADLTYSDNAIPVDVYVMVNGKFVKAGYVEIEQIAMVGFEDNSEEDTEESYIKIKRATKS